MKGLLTLLLQILTTIPKLLGPGGTKAIVADSLLMIQQLLVIKRSRRIVGFGAHAGDVDGIALCHIFNTANFTQGAPHYLSSDNDPLFRYHRWQANLRILKVQEIKTFPYGPLSHPFIERLIGILRRKFLDPMFFWNSNDLERRLEGPRGITTRNAFTLCSAATHHQKPLAKPPAAVPASINSSGNRIAAGCTSYP
jgi:hypothetical protein